MVRGILDLGTTFGLACVSALVFLVLSCQREGRPFGPSSRWWALAAIALTSVVSTAAAFVGVLLIRHVPPALLGVVVPCGLWFGHIQRPLPEHRRRRLPEVPTLGISLLLDRVHQGIAEDRLTWCEDRIDRMWTLDWLLAAARYYHAHVKERVPSAQRPRVRLDAKLKAIEHRVDVATIIENGGSHHKVHTALRRSNETKSRRYERYRGNLPRLGHLLRSDAEQELTRLLGIGYKFGCYRLPRFSEPARNLPLAKPRPHR